MNWIRKLTIVGSLALSGLVGVFIACLLNGHFGLGQNHEWNESNIAQSKHDGDAVAAALEAFSRAHGRYPERLEQLVPEQLRAIPLPIAGEGVWNYQRSAPGFGPPHYSLWFESKDAGNIYTRDESTSWEFSKSDL